MKSNATADIFPDICSRPGQFICSSSAYYSHKGPSTKKAYGSLLLYHKLFPLAFTPGTNRFTDLGIYIFCPIPRVFMGKLRPHSTPGFTSLDRLVYYQTYPRAIDGSLSVSSQVTPGRHTPIGGLLPLSQAFPPGSHARDESIHRLRHIFAHLQ